MGACEFILNEMILFEDEDTLCFAYIPGEQARVYNANMLGAALLARIYSHTKNKNYFEKSKKAMAYSVAALNDDYSCAGEVIDVSTDIVELSVVDFMACGGATAPHAEVVCVLQTFV